MTVIINPTTVIRVSGATMAYGTSVYATDPKATTGFAMYLGGRFDVRKVGPDTWQEVPGTLRPIKKGAR